MRKSDSELEALDKILAMDDVTISANLAEQALGVRRGLLGDYDTEKPEKIQFPYIASGNRVSVIRIPFLRYIGRTEEEIDAKKRLR